MRSPLSQMMFSLAVCALFGMVFQTHAQVDQANIDKLKRGEITEAKASWWGFDPVDSTAALQTAIDSGAAKLIVEDMGKPWIVTPIQLASNQEIVFEKGVVVEAKKGEFKGRNDSLFTSRIKENISLIGYGATLRMQRDDYDSDAYEHAEWRHVLDIRSSTHVKIYGLTLAESGGDGIYLGVGKRGITNTNIHIKDVICDKNYRQGISVISAKDMLIENTIMRDTDGTAPRAGIDFEPNNNSECVVNCIMRNCISENNAGCGFVFYLPNLDGSSAPLSVRLENCIARGSNSVPFAFTTGNAGSNGTLKGTAEFVDCLFSDGSGSSIGIRGKSVNGPKITFRRCRITNPADKPKVTPIVLATRSGNMEDIGGIEFIDCVLDDPVDRPPMIYGDWEGELLLKDVTGNIEVHHGDRTEMLNLTPEYVAGLIKVKPSKRIPNYDMSQDTYVPVLDTPPIGKFDHPPYSIRKKGMMVLYASQGEKVAFTLDYRQVGKYGGRPMNVATVCPSGKELKIGKVPFQEQVELSFTAPETGLYRMELDPGPNLFRVLASSHPICASGEFADISFISSLGDVFFYVPQDTAEFGVKIRGQGEGEAIGATVFDPQGKTVWNRSCITLPEQFAATPTSEQTGKAWRIRFERPEGTTMEDFYLRLQGIPRFISSNPDMLLKPTR